MRLVDFSVRMRSVRSSPTDAISSRQVSMAMISFLSSGSTAFMMCLQKLDLPMRAGNSLSSCVMVFLIISVTVRVVSLSGVSRRRIISLAWAVESSWSRRLTNSLQSCYRLTLGSSYMQERKAQSTRKAHSLRSLVLRLASSSTLLWRSCLLSPFIWSCQYCERRAKQIILSRLPTFSYISAIFMHTRRIFSRSASPPSRFSSTFSPCRKQLICFSVSRGSSASWSRISLEVAWVQPSDLSQISSDFRNIFSHLEGSLCSSCSKAKVLQTVMVRGWAVPRWQLRQLSDFSQYSTPLLISFRWVWYFSRIWKGRIESECFSGMPRRAIQAYLCAWRSLPILKQTSASSVQKQDSGRGPMGSVRSGDMIWCILERIFSSLMHSSSFSSFFFCLQVLQICFTSAVSRSQVRAEPCTSSMWAVLKMESRSWKKGQSMILSRTPKWQQSACRIPPPCSSGGQAQIRQSQQRCTSLYIRSRQNRSPAFDRMKMRLSRSTKVSLNSASSSPSPSPRSSAISWKAVKKYRLQARAIISTSRIFLLKSRLTFSASEPMQRMLTPYSCSRSSMPWLSTRNTVVLSSSRARLEMWSSLTRLQASASSSSPSGSGRSLTSQKTTLERGVLALMTTSGRRQPTDLMMSLSMKSGHSLAMFMRQKQGWSSWILPLGGQRMESGLMMLRRVSLGRIFLTRCSSRVRLKGIGTDFLSDDRMVNYLRLRQLPMTRSISMYSSRYWQMVPVGPCTRVSRPSQGLSAMQRQVQPMYLTRQLRGTRMRGIWGSSLTSPIARLLRMLLERNSWWRALVALQLNTFLPPSALLLLTRPTRMITPSTRQIPSSFSPLRLQRWSISSMHFALPSPPWISVFTSSMHLPLNSARKANSLNQSLCLIAWSSRHTQRYSHCRYNLRMSSCCCCLSRLSSSSLAGTL